MNYLLCGYALPRSAQPEPMATLARSNLTDLISVISTDTLTSSELEPPMNQAADNNMSIVPCAMVYAGREMLMALPHRAGRFPIQITSVAEPLIAWSCADGQQECVALQGKTASEDHTNVLAALEARDLLVLEVIDLADIDLASGLHHLVGFSNEHTARDRT